LHACGDNADNPDSSETEHLDGDVEGNRDKDEQENNSMGHDHG
jgi:hypothetical protein